MKRRLFLDDNADRRRCFGSAYPSAMLVETAADTITALSEPWDEVWLDHDLGDRVFVDSAEEETGAGVVRWILTQPERLKVAVFYVHSLNEPAAREMITKLQDAGYEARYCPWFDLVRELVS